MAKTRSPKNLAIKKRSDSEIVVPNTSSILVGNRSVDRLLKILARPNQFLTDKQMADDIRKRQDAISRFLLPGGADFLQALFAKAREINITLNFSTLDLGGFIFAGLKIEGPNFEKLGFSEADLTGANIQATRFLEALGVGANFTDAIVTGSDFRSAVLSRINAKGTRFIGCDFTGAIMNDMEIDERTNFAGSIFKGTYMQRVPIEKANLAGIRNHGIIR